MYNELIISLKNIPEIYSTFFSLLHPTDRWRQSNVSQAKPVFYSSRLFISAAIISGRMGIVGLSQGLPNHLWYTWLDRLLPGKALVVVCKKVIADQLIASPLSSSTFFVGASLLEGYSIAESVEEFRSKFLMVYLVIHLKHWILS